MLQMSVRVDHVTIFQIVKIVLELKLKISCDKPYFKFSDFNFLNYILIFSKCYIQWKINRIVQKSIKNSFWILKYITGKNFKCYALLFLDLQQETKFNIVKLGFVDNFNCIFRFYERLSRNILIFDKPIFHLRQLHVFLVLLLAILKRIINNQIYNVKVNYIILSKIPFKNVRFNFNL